MGAVEKISRLFAPEPVETTVYRCTSCGASGTEGDPCPSCGGETRASTEPVRYVYHEEF